MLQTKTAALGEAWLRFELTKIFATPNIYGTLFNQNCSQNFLRKALAFWLKIVQNRSREV